MTNHAVNLSVYRLTVFFQLVYYVKDDWSAVIDQNNWGRVFLISRKGLLMDKKAMYKLSYGLFVLTTKLGEKDNGCITNTAI